MSDAELEAEARRRLAARRDFWRAMVVFVIIAVVLTVIWAATGAGYFWPGWPIGALAVAALFMVLNLFGALRSDLRQSDVDAEVERMRRRS